MTPKKLLFAFIFYLLPLAVSSQNIIGAAMLDGKGNRTENTKKAKYLLVLKKINDTAFEKLDYHFAGPMRTKITYKDSLLTMLNGTYADFSKAGYIASEGNYFNNKKEGSWYVYDDTAHAAFEYKYYHDSLISIINLDSLSNEKKKIKEDTTGQVEAEYKGGHRNYMKLIQANLSIPDRTADLTNGGTVRVRFVIGTDGKPQDIKIAKSVEFAFDEESMRVIALGTEWIPAVDKGKKVKAYREQPVTISFR
jgi:TonB family protein